MKRYLKEIIILTLQVLMFYILPLFAGPTDMMGLVFLLILFTCLSSIAMGAVSNSKIKYLYPPVISVAFIPSVFIYYNSSALIHAVWYLVVSIVGLLVGVGVNFIFCKMKEKIDK